jgi:hypothetical protein
MERLLRFLLVLTTPTFCSSRPVTIGWGAIGVMQVCMTCAVQAPIGGGAPSVTSRLGSLERGLTELAAALGTKVRTHPCKQSSR